MLLLGLAIAAHEDDAYIGSGYIDTGLTDSGITKIECPDPTTLIAYTTDPSERIFQIYVPILPKHIWGKFDYKKIADEKFDAPLVGTGPYTLAEWRTGQFADSSAIPNYWRNQGFEDEVVLQILRGQHRHHGPGAEDGRARLRPGPQQRPVQAAAGRPGVHGPSPVRRTVGPSSPSTPTAPAPARPSRVAAPPRRPSRTPRSATRSGYAVDKQALVDRVLGGFGDVGDDHRAARPDRLPRDADTLRTFSIETAKQKLDAAGYPLVNGKRMDKEGKPISLRLYYPNTTDDYPKVAAFVQELVRPARDHGHPPVLRQRHADRAPASARG